VESRRLGRIGLCADPLVFALRMGLVRSPADYLAAARYRLLQEIGVAFVLRIAPLSQRAREQLKSPDAVHQLRRLGHTAGLLIGQALGLQTPEQAHAAQALWQQISAAWFDRVEMGARHYVIPSPELRAFDAELQLTGQMLQCVFPAGAATPPSGCAAQLKADIDAVGGFVRRALTP
jgi:hypothetical protein